jgi:hypothetical protein
MTKFIEVQAVAGVERPNNIVPFGGTQDDLERDEAPDQAPVGPTGPVEILLATRINVETIRSYNVRKGDRVGTRIVFINGTALPVADLIEVIDAKIAALG